MALFCFHSSRFEARFNESGKVTLYGDQDQAKWNKELIQKGEGFLKLSSNGSTISKYHLEALIAFWHTRVGEEETEKWNNVLQLYNRLLQIDYSPIIALNRTYALSKVKGKAEAIKEVLKIKLEENHLYYSLLAYFHEGIDRNMQKKYLELALELAKTKLDKQELKEKINNLAV